MDSNTYRLFFSAGESSGDQHAASMFTELKKRLPDIQASGMGGLKMQQAGIHIVFDSSKIAVIGLFEVIKHYPDIRHALNQLKERLLVEKPDLLICVDYKEFNLKLARFAKQHGIKVLFYVSPQVWAWRSGRVESYGKAIDMMAVIFPFEVKYYQEKSIPVRYVGHPSVDKVIPQRSKQADLENFSLFNSKPIIGILPGSREGEIRRILPIMLQAVERLSQRYPRIQFILPQADSISDALLNHYLQACSQPICVIKNQPYDVMQCCDVIMTTSGTASLETALLKIPMVIVYKLSPVTYFLAKYLVQTRYIGLPNIIAEKSIVKELIQNQLTAENLLAEVSQILDNPTYKKNMLKELEKVKEKLGSGGGSKNMADLVVQMLTA